MTATKIGQANILDNAVGIFQVDDYIRTAVNATNSTTPPTPTPGEAKFSVSPAFNKLVATVGINVGDMNAVGVYITRNDATAPTSILQFSGGAFTDFTFAVVALTSFLVDDVIRTWVWDSDAGVAVQATDENGNTSISTHAVDTLGPSGGAVTVDQDTVSDSDTEVRLTAETPDDVGSGYDHSEVRDPGAQTIIESAFDLDQTFTELKPNTTYAWEVVHYDAAGNPGAPIPVGFKTTQTVAANAGDHQLTAASFGVDETDVTITTPVERNNRVGSITSALDVRTRQRIFVEDYEYKGGTFYEFDTTTGVSSANDTITPTSDPGWSSGQAVTAADLGGVVAVGFVSGNTYYVHAQGAGAYTLHETYADAIADTNRVNLTASGAETQVLAEGANVSYEEKQATLSWGATDDADKNFTFRVIDRTSAFNSNLQVEIVPGTALAGGVSAEGIVGAQRSALVNVAGTGGTNAGFQQSSDSEKIIVVNFADSNVTRSAGADAADVFNVITDGRADTGQVLQPSIDCYPGFGDASTSDADAPDAEFDANFLIGGDHDVFIRMWRQGPTHDTVHLDYEGAGTTTLLGFHSQRYDVANAPTSDAIKSNPCWEWTHEKADGTDRTLTATAGVRTIKLTCQDYQAKIDKIVIAPTAANPAGPGTTYDPSAVGDTTTSPDDERKGPSQSIFSSASGGATDNPYLAVALLPPIPTGTISPDTQSPAHGELDAAFGAGLVNSADFDGTVQLVERFYAAISGVPLAAGNPVIDPVTGNVSITVTDTLATETYVDVVLKCYVIDAADGLLKYYDSTTAGWQFRTAQQTASGDFVFRLLNFNHRSAGAYTVDMALADFPCNASTYEHHTPAVGYCTLVADPEGGGDLVLQTRHPIGSGGGSWNCIFDLSSAPAYDGSFSDVLYRRWMFRFDPNNDEIKSVKLATIGDGTQLEMSHGASGPPLPGDEGGYAGVVSFVNVFTVDSADAWPARGNMSPSNYFYDYNDVQRNDFFSILGDCSELAADQVHLPKGEWIEVFDKTYMGTAGNADGYYAAWLTIPSLGWVRRKSVHCYHRYRGPAGGNIDPRRWWDQIYLGGSITDPLNKARTAPFIVQRKVWEAKTTNFFAAQDA